MFWGNIDHLSWFARSGGGRYRGWHYWWGIQWRRRCAQRQRRLPWTLPTFCFKKTNCNRKQDQRNPRRNQREELYRWLQDRVNIVRGLSSPPMIQHEVNNTQHSGYPAFFRFIPITLMRFHLRIPPAN